MTSTDLDAVNHIANHYWGKDYYESRKVYANKLAHSPKLCRVLELDNKVQGYLVAHYYQLNTIPRLNDFLDIIPADSIHIHDIVILPEYRKKGWIQNVLRDIVATNICTLVAANKDPHTEAYWQNHWQFESTDQACDYGIYMVRHP